MTQLTIKILLIAAVVVVGWYSLRGGTRVIHRVIWRGYVVVIVIAAMLSILFPSGLTRIAQQVGVGRGADLLLYVLVITFGLVSAILFRRLDSLERRYVDLARLIALHEAGGSEGHESGHRTGDMTGPREP